VTTPLRLAGARARLLARARKGATPAALAIRVVGALALALALAAPAAPQARELVLDGPSSSTRIAAALHRGHPAVPLSSLRHLGLHGETDAEGARLFAFGDTLVFHTLSPFFSDGDSLHNLVDPVYTEGGVLYVPLQFVEEWLPSRYPSRIVREDGRVRLRAQEAARAGSGGRARATPTRAPAGEPVDETRVVILDAGHGGPDNGAIGARGVREKDVNLAITMRVAQHLRQMPGYEVHLTRTTDTLIALFDRPKIANRLKRNRPSALFVSIHANSSSSRGAQGFETFIYSEARTADERAVAERENAVVSYDGEQAVQGADELGFILSNLRNDYYVRASHDLASVVQDELRGFHPGSNRGVKQAPLVVLVGAYMPAVLVETAFVSNAREEQLLSSAQFQQRTAYAIAQAIDEFFEEHEFLWQDGET